jgi:hypothetical protein
MFRTSASVLPAGAGSPFALLPHRRRRGGAILACRGAHRHADECGRASGGRAITHRWSVRAAIQQDTAASSVAHVGPSPM